ncbi:DUF6283 family protein [Streptomyces sp. NPDC001985]|uniref:DUF6283 family protein n=1 Tax=Streptomyces sp. NPDC001985 TaxID=3154406 RepID=UPI003319B655
MRHTPRQPEIVESSAACLAQGLFACHMIKENDVACAGWLAVAGNQHLTVRHAPARGLPPGHVLKPGDGWPPLFDDFDQMADRQAPPQPRPRRRNVPGDRTLPRRTPPAER